MVDPSRIVIAETTEPPAAHFGDCMLGEIQPHIEQIEAEMLRMPQADCPVVHHFGPGIYIREVTLKAGTLAVGHAQKFEHLNIMLTGSVAIVDDGQIKTLKAPMIYVGKPGRKMGYVLEDTVWLNVYSTEEQDIDKLEETYLEKSQTWMLHNEMTKAFEHERREGDRQSFKAMVDEIGVSEDLVREQSENEEDQIPMPAGFENVTVRPSSIEGLGVFLSSPVKAGMMIGPARIDGKRTPLGRFTNHSQSPNAQFVNVQGQIWMIALTDIAGCCGGSQGEEVTVNYRQSIALLGELECQA